MEQWPVAVRAVNDALRFLRERVGVTGPVVLPSQTMVLPLADAIIETAENSDFAKELEKWFWCSTFAQTYSQGANTQAVSDAKGLRAWRQNRDAVPDVVKNFSAPPVEILHDRRRRNEILTRGIACLLIRSDARDWKEDIRLAAATERLDYHHIFPSQFLKNKGLDEEEADVVVNLTPLIASTNRSLRNDPPEVVAERVDISKPAMGTHALSNDIYAQGDWNGFLKDRAKRITHLIEQATKRR